MGITHLSGLEVAGVPTMGIGGAPFFTGNWFFVDAVNGSDGNTGAADNPFATVYWAYQQMVSGHNDVCVIVGSGTTAGTQRLSAAGAIAANPAATSGSLIWAKNACHLIGQCSGGRFSQRARFAPPTGVYTAATFLNGQTVSATPFINISGSGCYFANFSVFCGFSTGDAGMLAVVNSGTRNVFNGVDIEGMADAASAAGAAARCLVVSGGENYFTGCTIGTDTVQRATNVNASLEFTGGVARNWFENCAFPLWTALTTSIIIKGVTGAIDRSTFFNNCLFVNANKSSSAAVVGIATLGTAGGGPNGDLVYNNPCVVGITGFGTDATTRALSYICGGTPSASATGLAVAATA